MLGPERGVLEKDDELKKSFNLLIDIREVLQTAAGDIVCVSAAKMMEIDVYQFLLGVRVVLHGLQSGLIHM